LVFHELRELAIRGKGKRAQVSDVSPAERYALILHRKVPGQLGPLTLMVEYQPPD
jgi:hypothetical protein